MNNPNVVFGNEKVYKKKKDFYKKIFIVFINAVNMCIN